MTGEMEYSELFFCITLIKINLTCYGLELSTKTFLPDALTNCYHKNNKFMINYTLTEHLLRLAPDQGPTASLLWVILSGVPIDSTTKPDIKFQLNRFCKRQYFQITVSKWSSISRISP